MPAPAERPNLIWIFGDQHRAQAMGYRGDPNLHTPNLDILADGGVRVDRAVAGFPLCCPFRGSLLSGRYPHRCVPGHEERMPPETPTVAHAFKAHGYHTSYFGKWHLDGFKEATGRAALHIVPPERRGGFDTWVGYENNNAQMDCWVHGGEGEGAFHERLEGYETDCMTDLFIDHIHQLAHREEKSPFFAALSVQPPHTPCVAPPEWQARHTPGQVVLRPNVPSVPRILDQARRNLAGYYAMIENLDWNVGRIVQVLHDLGLYDNTHILFFSDHGDSMGSHGQFAKMNPYEESIRVPFIIGGGASYTYKGGAVDAPVNHVDIAPTSLGLCGLPVPEGMAGYDYAGLRRGDRSLAEQPDSAYLQVVQETCHGNSVDRPWRGLVTRDGWKYVCLEHQPWLLFNLNEDPYEQVNLAHNSRYWPERKRLHDRLAQWVTETGDHFALPKVQTKR